MAVAAFARLPFIGLNLYLLNPINSLMKWTVVEHPDFRMERRELDAEVSDKLDTILLALEETGPRLGRPWVDTLKGSRHRNMKEIRINCREGRMALCFCIRC